MWGSIATKVIIGLGPITIIFFLLGKNLVVTYCFKSEAILKSWPNIRVCLFSNNWWLNSSIIENVPVILIGSITPIILVTLACHVTLVALVGLVSPIVPITLEAWFSIFKPKFPRKLVLPKVCVLALNSSLGGSFCCKVLIVSSNKCSSFSSSCHLTKLLFLWGSFYLNTTFLGIWILVVTTIIMFTMTSFFLSVTTTTFF